jgi:hypothetical protein
MHDVNQSRKKCNKHELNIIITHKECEYNDYEEKKVRNTYSMMKLALETEIISVLSIPSLVLACGFEIIVL